MQRFSSESSIYALGFSVLGPDEIRARSNVNVVNKELFRASEPVEGGPYDAHMGTTSLDWACQTCMNLKTRCPGHIGSTDLVYPVKSPMFREQLLKWLKAVCLECSAPMSAKNIRGPKDKLLANYVKAARTETTCPNCGAEHPVVIKDKLDQSNFYTEVYEAGKPIVRKTLYNHVIKTILNRITDETVIKLGKPLKSHPRKFVLDTIVFPANTIRPDIRRFSGGRSNNHTVTALMKAIMEIANALPASIPPPAEIDRSLHVMLHNLDTVYFDMVKGSTATNNQIRVATSTGKALGSIAGGIPKKYGRIRRNILGKRVLNIVRSVITGDPTLRIDEIGFPKAIARTISIPMVVQDYNRHIATVYFKNGRDVYPGCEGVRTAIDGKMFDVEYMKDYELQNGDIVYRDMIDGDIVIFNRAPSLTWTSVASHKVVILEKSNTLRFNVSGCSLYNADFDGDAMTAIVPRNVQSINEARHMSKIGNWFTSFKNSSPMIGAFQDSLIGTAEFTRNGIKLNKWHAMAMMARVEKSLKFDRRMYTNREVFSMLLPKINLIGKKPSMYMPQYAALIDYDPQDIRVEINRGQLISGILDKATVGQSTMGSLFHVINNEYGSAVALEVIHHIQQLTIQFFYYRGFTTGVSDLVISESAKRRIRQKILEMTEESARITDKLDRRELTPPIGTTQEEFFEMEQMNAMEPGDGFINPVLSSIDFKTNGLAKLVFYGSKGNSGNVAAINVALGTQKIRGRRPERNFGWGRTSPYFARYDTRPDSMGHVAASYNEGIPSKVYAFAAGTGRQGAIEIALSTGVTGHQSRVAIKNMESIVINNLRQAAKPQSVVQSLCLESGIDPRRTEKVKFPTVLISDAEMKKYHVKSADVHKRFRGAKTSAELDAEYEALVVDREKYRAIMIKMERLHPGNMVMGNTHQMPVNVRRIIEDTVYMYKDEAKEDLLDPIRTVEKVRALCRNIAYAYFNEAQEKAQMRIPEHVMRATTFLQILLRSHLCVRHMLDRGIGDNLLDIIIAKVKVVFANSLFQYGTAIGIISAQSISEPMTQMSLDTKHRVGAGARSKTNPIVRIMEIIGVRPTKTMKNPSMTIIVDEKFEHDKSKVQSIANRVEMMKLERFISSVAVFFEKFGEPVHPKFKHEKKMIATFQRHQLTQPPDDLAKWCIRFSLSSELLMINNMSVETIIQALQIKFQDAYFVYTPENARDVIIRCYVRGVIMKTNSEEAIMEIMRQIRNTTISGIQGIHSTHVISYIKSSPAPDGSIKTGKAWSIAAIGTNMQAVMETADLDGYRSQTDSVVEFEEMFGIEAARGKIVAEMLKTINANRAHCTMYADEMSYSGQLSSIQRSGMAKREKHNICLRMAFQSPNQVLEDAATHGLTSEVTGVSGKLIVGAAPNVGTAYNRLVVNRKFLQEHAAKMSRVEDVL